MPPCQQSWRHLLHDFTARSVKNVGFNPSSSHNSRGNKFTNYMFKKCVFNRITPVCGRPNLRACERKFSVSYLKSPVADHGDHAIKANLSYASRPGTPVAAAELYFTEGSVDFTAQTGKALSLLITAETLN